MSELTRCNYCSLKVIRRRAAIDGNRVLKRNNATWGLGGMNVYVMPPDIELPKDGITEDSEFHKTYFVSWLMELSDGCVC